LPSADFDEFGESDINSVQFLLVLCILTSSFLLFLILSHERRVFCRKTEHDEEKYFFLNFSFWGSFFCFFERFLKKMANFIKKIKNIKKIFVFALEIF
jgi:hypothetical protein